MTNESKIIISLASLMAISLAGAATSTVAWFATVRTAAVNMTDVTVQPRGNNLRIEVSDDINTYCGIEANASGVTDMANSSSWDSSSLTGTSQGVTDVSSDGKSFYRPKWLVNEEATSSNAGQAYSIPLTPNVSSAIYYVQFGIKLSNTGNVQGNVYLENPSSIYGILSSTPDDELTEEQIAQKAKDTLAAKAMRVALYTVEDNKPSSLLTYWGQDVNDYYKHLSLNSTHKDAWNGTDEDLKEAAANAEAYKVVESSSPLNYDYRKDGMEITEASKIHKGAFATLSKEADFESASNAFIATIPAESSAYIYVSCWIEGTSKYATNDCIGGEVGVKLSFVSFDHAGA